MGKCKVNIYFIYPQQVTFAKYVRNVDSGIRL